MSLIKTSKDIMELRIAGKKLAEVLIESEKIVQVGVKLIEIENFIHAKILELGCKPSFLHYQGFPAASCLSLNEQVVHGIPDHRVLKDGDVLGVDVGLWYNNLCVDAAYSKAVGKIDQNIEDLLKYTKLSLEIGIKAIKPYRRIGIISHSVQQVAEKHQLGIVTNLTGHGVGHSQHEDPAIPNYGRPNDGIIMRPGMVLAIEPMLTLGSGSIYTEADGWGIVTADHSISAHFEHTVLVTDKGYEILTKLN